MFFIKFNIYDKRMYMAVLGYSNGNKYLAL